MAKIWTDRERSSISSFSGNRLVEQWVKSVAEQWRVAGCAADGAPYVVRALLARGGWELYRDSPEVPKVAAAFLDTDHCPGARGLSEAELAKLKAIRDYDSPPPPAPKP